MQIRLISDLHFETQEDGGRSFVDGLDPAGCDVLVVAGDLTKQTAGIIPAISMLCQRFPRVVYVCGNHEYYGADRGKVNTALRIAQQRNPNLRHLNNDILVIDGQRILGSTLWFPQTKLARLQAAVWSDFRAIRGFSKWVYEENQKAVTFFRRELREGDIVVTHHLPTFLSVHPKYAASVENCFYVTDLEELITERKPALWMHGHTHESMDMRIGSTRVVCNPFGYVGDLNPRYTDGLTLEVVPQEPLPHG